jgi:hypothetical protein
MFNYVWHWRNGHSYTANPLMGEWASGQPDGKTGNGIKIGSPKFAIAVMDANGKLRDEKAFDYHMCICEILIS